MEIHTIALLEMSHSVILSAIERLIDCKSWRKLIVTLDMVVTTKITMRKMRKEKLKQKR